MGTAFYDKVCGSIIFLFKEYSSNYAYKDSLDLATSIAANHRTNKWLFDKRNFASVITEEILIEIKEWSKRCCYRLKNSGVKEKCRIAIVTSGEIFTDNYYRMFNEKLNKDSELEYADIRLFNNNDEAMAYLKTPVKEYSQAG